MARRRRRRHRVGHAQRSRELWAELEPRRAAPGGARPRDARAADRYLLQWPPLARSAAYRRTRSPIGRRPRITPPEPDSKTKEHNCLSIALWRSAIAAACTPRAGWPTGSPPSRRSAVGAQPVRAARRAAAVQALHAQVTGGKPARCNAGPANAVVSVLALSYAQPAGPLPASAPLVCETLELAAAGFRLIATPPTARPRTTSCTPTRAAARRRRTARRLWYCTRIPPLGQRLPQLGAEFAARAAARRQPSRTRRMRAPSAAAVPPRARASGSSKLATTLRDSFARDHLLREHFYDYVHIRRLRNGCNDTPVANVTAHVRRHLNPAEPPLVLSSSFRRVSASTRSRRRRARQVILPPATHRDPGQQAAAATARPALVLRPSSNMLRAAERAGAGAQAFYVVPPCGRVRLAGGRAEGRVRRMG